MAFALFVFHEPFSVVTHLPIKEYLFIWRYATLSFELADDCPISGVSAPIVILAGRQMMRIADQPVVQL